MQMIHRFGSGESEEYFGHYLALLKEYPKEGNTVWFASHYGFPPLEKHEKESARLVEIAGKFRENHIGVSLQISNTLVHCEYMSSQDCTGLVYDGSPAENMVAPDGTKANYCFCWNGKHFRDYTKKAVTAYAALHPDCIWFDDDLRPNNHAPVPFGCFCSDCIASFNQKYSSAKPFTREKLVEEFLYGDLKVRENWINFVREGLYSFTYEICSEVHEALPDCEFGYQYCANGAYTGRGFDYILNAMKAANGKDPLTRPGGGAYSDHNPGEFLSKASFLSRANALLPPYVKCKCPEIENLPFEAYEKSPAGCAFECAYYMAGGATDMSFSMMMHENERREYYEETLRLLSANDKYKYRRRLAAENARTVAAGMRFFISDFSWRRKLNKAAGEDFYAMNSEYWWGANYWIRDGLPLTFEAAEKDVILLHPETAKPISREEYEKLLGGYVLAVRNPRGEKFTLMRQGTDEEIAISAEKTLTAGGNEEYVLKLPSVPAYTVCTVFID